MSRMLAKGKKLRGISRECQRLEEETQVGEKIGTESVLSVVKIPVIK